jgi:hypothetical protein
MPVFDIFIRHFCWHQKIGSMVAAQGRLNGGGQIRPIGRNSSFAERGVYCQAEVRPASARPCK